MEFSAFCIVNSGCACCCKNMANLINEARNEILEGLPGIQDVHDLQFGDVGSDDATPDSQDENIPMQDIDGINCILERQAKAIEKLASGIKDIAEALHEIAVALASQNPHRDAGPPEAIETPDE